MTKTDIFSQRNADSTRNCSATIKHRGGKHLVHFQGGRLSYKGCLQEQGKSVNTERTLQTKKKKS